MLHRRLSFRLTLASAIVLVGTSSACNDRALVAPESLAAPQEIRRSDGAVGAPVAVKPSITIVRAAIVRRTQPLTVMESQCAYLTPVIPSGSMSVALKKAGLKVHFSSGAVTTPTRVCLVAHPGALLTYSFYPHGLRFNNEIKVQQDLHNTTAWKNPTVMSGMLGGYLANGVERDVDSKGVGSFAQVFNIYFSDETGTFTKTTPSLVKFYTNHFSGYALASGRSE